MMFSTIFAVFCLFIAFMITALEPRLSERSARLALARLTDTEPPLNAVGTGVDTAPVDVDGYAAAA